MSFRAFRSRTLAAAFSALAPFALAACFQTQVAKRAPTSATGTATSTSATSTTFKISNVKMEAGASGQAAPSATVYFDTSAQSAAISNFCKGSGSATSPASSKPCSCQFTWTEVNSSTGTPVTLSRSVVSFARTVQANLVTCNGPLGYFTNEIPNATQINVKVVPGSGSAESFSTNSFKFAKNTTGKAGSFEDVQGRIFDNVLRYTCYEQFKRGTQVTNKLVPYNNPTDQNEKINVAVASQFCAKKDGGAADPNCATSTIDYSSQAYYYNLFIRESERGDINSGSPGGRYVCPMVKEALNYDTSSIGTQNKAWPLDKSFALSRGPSGDYPVAVEAFTKLSNGDDPTSQGSSCYGDSSTDSGSGSGASGSAGDRLVKSCLGFAAKPSSDGTCPLYKSSTGTTSPMFRLRRFVALLPPQFNADGSPITGQGQATDVIYVADREVSGSRDASKPYTMLGPKPCPYAWFDSSGALGVGNNTFDDPAYTKTHGKLMQYAATNYPGWAGRNVDGLQFPNRDEAGSCSAALPVVSDDKSVLSIATINENNPGLQYKFIRAIQPWNPHYVEDTSFQACAPKASNPVDPPLHFARDLASGNVRWCAEVYPSRNDNVAALDWRPDPSSAYVGRIKPFTSHVIKNSTSAGMTSTGTGCTTGTRMAMDSIKSLNYPAALATGFCNMAAATVGEACHKPGTIIDVDTLANGATTNLTADKTCDRTFPYRASGWARIPLLASAPLTEDALRKDDTYGCTITYDGGNGKKGVDVPTSGCCSVANVQLIKKVPAGADPLAAHLETDISCGTPTY